MVYNSFFFQVNNLRILDEIVKTFLSNGNYNFHRLELRKQRNMDEKGKEENKGGGEEEEHNTCNHRCIEIQQKVLRK